ncbi:MAG: DUF4071 domain-containing protein [Gemmatimonadetes bacterium]|nr:DUF4071 domain-containing protein [Gemmatimonadota bacterium]
MEARGGSDEDFAKSLFHRLGTFGIEAQLEPHILFGDPSPGAVKTAARSVRVAVLLHSAQWSREMDPLPVVEPLLRRARKKPEALTVAVGRLDEAPLPPALAGLPLIDLAPLRLSLDGRSAPSWGAVETLARSLRGLVTPDAPTSAAAPSAGPGTPAPDVAQRDVRGLVDTMLEDLTQVRRAGGGKKPSNPRSIHALALRWIETGLGGSDVPVEAARLLMAASDPERALEVLDEALEAADRGMEPRDLARLQRARGEALAELGRTDEALDALEALSRAEPLDAWTGGILAGVYKRQWLALGKRRRSLLLRAYQTYRDTYARTLHYYPGINAATLARLLGKEDEARALATRLRDRLSAENDLYFWDEATLGEAHLLLGDHDAAVRAYESAVVQALEQRNRRALVSMRRQIPLILEGSQDPAADDTARLLAQLFDVGHVGVFAGLRVQEGFPLERERWVRRALREALERHDIAVGCGCGEAGADLVCAELLLERSGEVEILLPYPRRLFRADLPDARWRERFDAVVGHERCSLIELSDTRPLDAAAARMHAAAAALDRAMELAGRREERATLIAFWDGDARRAREAYVVQAARDEGLETDVLRLDAADRSDPTPAAEAEADAATSDAAPRAAEGGGAAPRLRALDLEVAVDTEPERLPGAYRTRHLLVIGIDRYRHWNRLENARSDATAVAGVLQDRFGFTLSTALYDEEATRTAIEEAFIGGLVEGKGASGRVQADDLVVLFFAGHGQTERRAKDDAEIGFLVPWEAPRVGRSALLRMSTVREWTDDLAARHVLFIFDSCFSGLATTGGGGGGRPGFARRVITAGAPNQKVADGGDLWPNHSIFTGRLLHGLTEDSTLQRPILELELAGYLARHVPLDARRAGAPRQTPSYGALPSHGGDTIVLTEGPIG